MARQYNDTIGGTFIVPAAYASITVANSNSGLSTTGVLAIIGEADAGPDWSEEAALGELQDNSFGPDAFQEVVDKYKSGRIVDAFKAAATAAVDPAINGAFTSCIIVKTNVGTKASATLTNIDSAAYPSLNAKAAGALGNMIYFNVTNPTTATLPTTGSVTWIPPVSNAKVVNVSANGLKAAAVTATTGYTPAAAQVALEALVGITCTGGASRSISAGAPTVTVALVSGMTATFTRSAGSWPAAVVAGDTLVVPAGSAIAGAGNLNVGAYQILSVVGTVITAIKLSDADKAGAVAGTVTAPGAANAAIAATAADLVAYAPLVITCDAPGTLAGRAASLEISEVSVVEEVLYTAGGVKAAWVSTSTSPHSIVGVSELSASLNVNRQSDNISEALIAGGEVGIEVGCTAAAATVTIDATQCILYDGAITTTLTLANYPSISDLTNYISSLTTWSAAPFTAILGNLPVSALDEGVFNCASYQGAKTARIKTDAYRMGLAVAGSALVSFASAPAASLPKAAATYAYLANGTKGATTAAGFTAAIDALAQTRCNFVVPLISRDASADIADGLTDAGSTYTVDAVNAQIKSHVHAMSTMKAKRNRQGFISKRDTFTVVSNAAANVASYRCAMVFQDVKSSVSGSVVQYQPYMGAVLAAATQAGAFYKSMVRKQANVSGVLQAAGDWSYNLDSNLENALLAGLNPLRRAEEGGFVWVSDQTTYGKDTNNVYNSIQMVYAADTVALTTAQRMERAFVGQSVADVSAPVALSYLDGIMADFLRLKLIAPSSDAPLGYKNARIVIQGPVMKVSVEVKIAGSIYFIPIAFYVTEITQAAQ
jgi:hypothetical protein